MLNQILSEIYRLYPAIAAWAKSGRPSPLWDSPMSAKHGLTQYLGPDAQVLYMDSQHVPEANRAFLRSPEALKAMWRVVDAIYFPLGPGHPRLVDGLFQE